MRPQYLFYKMVVMPQTIVGTLELAILLAITRLGNDAYGLAIRRDLAERTDRDYSVGAVYTTLQRLERKGFVESFATEPLPVRGGRSRRQFRLTAAGSRALREAKRHTTSIWAGVGRRLRPRLA